jgi:hypothetical protein
MSSDPDSTSSEQSDTTTVPPVTNITSTITQPSTTTDASSTPETNEDSNPNETSGIELLMNTFAKDLGPMSKYFGMLMNPDKQKSTNETSDDTNDADQFDFKKDYECSSDEDDRSRSSHSSDSSDSDDSLRFDELKSRLNASRNLIYKPSTVTEIIECSVFTPEYTESVSTLFNSLYNNENVPDAVRDVLQQSVNMDIQNRLDMQRALVDFVKRQ